MPTKQVPGSNPADKDILFVGAWAEHDDGSMLLIEGDEDDVVVFSVFDIAKDPVVEYRDAMPVEGFDKQFSDTGWTWHDKTPFPWAKVM